MNNSKKVGVIAPSLRNNDGGLEFQVKNLLNHLPFEYEFYFDKPENFMSVKFKLLKDHEINNIGCFLMFFSWREAEFWCDIFRELPHIPLLYSERSAPDLVVMRWNQIKREELFKRANMIHLFDPIFCQKDEYIYNKYAEKIFYTPNIPFRFLKNKNQLLYVGKVNRFPKRTHWLLQAVSRHPDIFLNVCGDVKDMSILREYSRFSNIHFHGYIKNDKKLLEQYEKADFLVLPSAFEGCPNAAIDADYLNIPTIGFRSCVGLSAVIKNFIGISKDTEGDLEKKICYCCGNPLKKYQWILKTWEKRIRELLCLNI